MKNWFRAVYVCFLVLFGSSPVQAVEPPEFINLIYAQALESGQTYDLLAQLCAGYPKRPSGSKGLEGVIEWSKQKMEEQGFDRVYLEAVKVSHWERGPAESAYINLAGDRKAELAVLALGRSGPTPEEGITATVIEARTLAELAEMDPENIRGKIVFFNKPFDQGQVRAYGGYRAAVDVRNKGPALASRLGASAVLVRSITSAYDDYPHTGSGKFETDEERIPVAALGVQSSERLSKVIADQPGSTVTLKINSHTYPDADSFNVIGEIRGSQTPDNIILVGGHLDAWDVGEGAHDDGAGSMHAISALATLKSLGYRPRNTLRVVLFTDEEIDKRGGKAYAQSDTRNGETHILAVESDAGGFTPQWFSFKGSDTKLTLIQSWLPYFPDHSIKQILKGSGGADIDPLYNTFGTPVMGLRPDQQRYFDLHHSAADVFSSVNRRELELGTAALASMLYLVDRFGLDSVPAREE